MQKIINDIDFDYRIIDKDTKHAVFIVSKENISNFQNLLIVAGYKSANHKYSRENGYYYLYGMDEPLLFEGSNRVEIYSTLACCCLERKRLMPFDIMIQERVWMGYRYIDGLKFIENDIEFIYKLAICIFEKRKFEDEYVRYFKANINVIDNDIFVQMCTKVFFQFTDKLLKKIRDNEYESIYESYIKYSDY